MGRKAATTCSSSSNNHHHLLLSTNSSLNLRLALGTHHHHQHQQHNNDNEEYCGGGTLFVKVYMEGIPIGRKLNILAHGSYHDLVNTLENMFDTTILWGRDMDEVVVHPGQRCHVLTYEDEEGDLVMVGDVPWEMFVSTVKRLKITRVDTFAS
ncbi:Iaa20p [Stylosanthes scabra]|uniref:Auxin-induced protein n=1 Tax=Stylosanthes scabra TaxID=79078 RepID=A0ABU6V5F9_9FABA|nr:Iaa20p [Stylosanthes scabra]